MHSVSSGLPPLPPIAETLKSLESGSVRLNKVATELSEQIIAFEKWLNRLPGKVETFLWLPKTSPDDPRDDFYFVLRFHRIGKQWVIQHGTVWEPAAEDPIAWERIVDASISTKIEAVKNFPALLAEIRKTQEKQIEEIEAAQKSLQNFTSALGSSLKKEGE